MRITKAMAESVAKKQLEPKFKEIQERRTALENEASDFAMSLMPKEVKEVFLKYPKYFDGDTNIVSSGGRYSFRVDVPSAEGRIVNDSIYETHISINADRKKLTNLEENLADVIYNLKTLKNVEQHLPELLVHFPEKGQVTNNLPVNFSQLRNAIKHP